MLFRSTYSDFNPCHGNVPDLIEAVKRGVLLSGALPMVFPTISIHESFSHPTSMYLRNLMAIDTEEMVRVKTREADIYKIIKVKLGRDEATDRMMIDAIRSVTDKPITVDANQGWKERGSALKMIEWLAGRGVTFIEQPMPKEQIDDTAWLRDRSPLPLVADENVQRLADVGSAMAPFMASTSN